MVQLPLSLSLCAAIASRKMLRRALSNSQWYVSHQTSDIYGSLPKFKTLASLRVLTSYNSAVVPNGVQLYRSTTTRVQ